MTDSALYEWLSQGARVDLTADEIATKRHSEFATRFVAALNPPDDLGPTEESHQRELARRVWAVHSDLNVLGEVEYSAVWRLLPASTRAALKAYVSMAKRNAATVSVALGNEGGG